ncbi:hypothetical protein TTSV1_gp28 [Thermoproteus tenax spherical virus 1]|uniref:Uncharacterized protein n=1 Tax=Thermoproteus tenax spherical virus 1 TaxID=292639 RepID=Q647D4_9VIRU|nr:hypothetical protein TTSV1_gp28 [Thermoproteus tenax spherical virus 1]AAU25978.1 hypothetical protein [Thermoproteus tenax spherical virus 1]
MFFYMLRHLDLALDMIAVFGLALILLSYIMPVSHMNDIIAGTIAVVAIDLVVSLGMPSDAVEDAFALIAMLAAVFGFYPPLMYMIALLIKAYDIHEDAKGLKYII